MNVGEMERLKEFGLKASSKDDPKNVMKQLQDMYTGGAEKLATSGSGLLSTITGKIKSNIADVGKSMLEPLKPVMTNVIGFIDDATPKMLEFGTKVGEGIGTAIQWLSDNMSTLQPIFSTVFGTLQSVATTVIPIFSQAFEALSPIFSVVGEMAFNSIQRIGEVVQAVAPYVKATIDALKPTFKNVASALENMGSIFGSIFDGVMSIVKNAYDTVKPLIDGIGGALKGVSGAISSATGWVANKLGGKKAGKNATGTKYWQGGLSIVGEHGPELVQMPSGSKVYTNTETNAMLNPSNNQPRQSTSSTARTIDSSINIAKLADTIIVREDADIDKIANALVSKLQQRKVSFGG